MNGITWGFGHKALLIHLFECPMKIPEFNFSSLLSKVVHIAYAIATFIESFSPDHPHSRIDHMQETEPYDVNPLSSPSTKRATSGVVATLFTHIWECTVLHTGSFLHLLPLPLWTSGMKKLLVQQSSACPLPINIYCQLLQKSSHISSPLTDQDTLVSSLFVQCMGPLCSGHHWTRQLPSLERWSYFRGSHVHISM